MIKKLIQFIKGYVRVHLQGNSYERFLNLCANHGIYLWSLLPAFEGYEVNMTIGDFKKLKPLIRKTRTKVTVVKKQGLPFLLHRHRKRKLFLAGFLCCLVLLILLSCFIWDIRIEGNYTVTRETVLEYLSTQGASHGTKKSDLDCKALAANLRRQFSDFIWVSVKIKGTRLFIDVQENTDLKLSDEKEYDNSDIVSNVEGTIVKMITRAGDPKVGAGSKIKKGDLLVLGRLEILDDGGGVSAYQYVPSDADIYVQTVLHYKEQFQLVYQKKQYTGKEKKSGYLKIFDSYLGIRTPNSSFENQDVVTREEQAMLTEDFYLPFSVGFTSANEYRIVTKKYSEKEALEKAKKALDKFLEKIQEKGVQIFENNVKIDVDDKICKAEGDITVIQKAGVRMPTEILEAPGEGTLSE